MSPADSGSSRTALKSVEFLVLAVLYEESLHGYGIVQAIAARTEGRVNLRPGDVYRVIYRLGQRGLLEQTAPGSTDSGHARRTYYALTDAGRAVAKAEAEMLRGISASLLAEGPKTEKPL